MEARGYLGLVFRLTATFCTERGLTAALRERVSPDTALLLEKPPFPFTWVPGARLEEIFVQLAREPRGPELCADLGHFVAGALSGSILAPVLQMALQLFGATPASVFGNLERFFAVATRGTSFSYAPQGERSGVVTWTAGADAPDALFHVTAGNLRQVYDLCKTTGTVSAPEREGAVAHYRVAW